MEIEIENLKKPDACDWEQKCQALLRDVHAKHEAELKKREDLIGELRDTITHLDKVSADQITQWQTRQAQAKQDAEKLTAQHEEEKQSLQSEIGSLRQKVSELQSEIDTCHLPQVEAGGAHQEVALLESEQALAKVRAEFASLEQDSKRQIELLQTEIASLKAQGIQDFNEQLRDELYTVTCQAKSLQDEVDRLTFECNKARKDLDFERKNAATLHKVPQLHAQLQAKDTEIQKAAEARAKLIGDMQSLEAQLREERDKLEKCKADMNTLVGKEKKNLQVF